MKRRKSPSVTRPDGGILHPLRQPESEVIARRHPAGGTALTRYTVAKAPKRPLFVMNAGPIIRAGRGSAVLSCLEHHHRGASCCVANGGANERLSGYAGSAGVAKVQKLSISALKSCRVFPPDLKSSTASRRRRGARKRHSDWR